MAQDEKEIATREKKLEEIIKLGVNPYPSKIERKTSVFEARKLKPKDTALVGKIVSIRSHGKSTFMDIEDESGMIQIYLKFDNLGEQKYNFLKLLDVGDYLQVKGLIFKTKSGEITLEVKSYELACKTLLPVPDKWFGLKDVELRYRKRFLDLIINDEVKQNLELRSKIIAELRAFMNKEGFIEIETPILQPIPGGAAAKPFITHYNILKQDMYLRIAPELYLKRLIVGGFEKVYEIGRNFRNEGLSHMHNPEFTMMEFYWAYKNYLDLMKFTEVLIETTVMQVKKTLKIRYQGNEINLAPPYPRITFDALIEKDCGINIYQYPNFKDLREQVLKKKIDLNFKEIKVWAKLVDELYKKVSRPKMIQPIFIVDHPLALIPLAKAKEDEPQKVQSFQLVLAGGIELVKAYTELNDPLEQERRLREQAKMRKAGYDESEMMDENFIESLKYGLPPTAGWGLGIERLVMLLTDQYSIKEVIPFPTLKNK